MVSSHLHYFTRHIGTYVPFCYVSSYNYVRTKTPQFQLVCEVIGSHTPSTLRRKHGAPWVCKLCDYAPSDSVTDPSYQESNVLLCWGFGLCESFSPVLDSLLDLDKLITPLPLPVVLLDRPLVVPLYACLTHLVGPTPIDGTQGRHRARNKLHGLLPQVFEYATGVLPRR